MLRTPAILGIVGVCLLILGIVLAADTHAFVSRSLQTEGSILRVERQYYKTSAPEGGDGVGMRYVYVIRFPTRSGKTVVIQRKTGDSTPYFRRGDPVPIRYTPHAPKRTARIATFGNLWGTAAFSGAVGALLVIFAAGLAAGRRAAPRPS